MRKIKLFLSMLMLIAFSVGNVWATDETVTYTLTGATTVSVTGTAPDGATVSASTNGSWISADSRLQLAGKTAQKNYTLTLSGFDGCTITGLKVKLGSNAKAGNAALTFVAGSETLASIASANLNAASWFGGWVSSGSEKTVTLSNDEYEIQEDEDVVLTITNTANSAYVYYVSVTYTPAATGDVIVKTLKSIAVEGMTTSYETGDAFSFDGTCTATYSVTKNEVPQADEEKTVTPTSVTSPDMSSAGVKTITVSFTDEETKTTTYDINVTAAQPKSTLIFEDEYKDSGATADDGAEWDVTSDAPESTYEAARGIHFGTGNSSQVQYLQLSTSDISGTITKVVVNASDATGTGTISVSVDGTDFTCGGSTTVANSNPGNDYTFTGSASGEIVVLIDRGSAAYKAIYVKSIVVYYIPAPQKTPAGLAYAEADKSNLVKVGASFTAPTLANPNSLSVAYTSSNTDVAEVAGDGTLTIKAVGVAEITASSEETDTYKAGSAKYTIYVVAHDGTEANPYTVADARVIIDKVGETGIAEQYVAGIVSNVKSLDPSKYQSAQYYISDNGERENEIYVYNGYYLSGANFTSADQLLEGDEVVVKGQILKYNKTTYEVAQGNQLVSLNRTKTAAGLAYVETAVEKNIGDAAFTNALTNPNNLEVSYSSSATGVATVDENGEVTIVGMGTTTIIATFAGNASYLADEVSYTLTVNDPSLVKVTFDAKVDIASDNAEGITKNGVNIKASHVDGVNGSNNAVTYYQCFKNATFTATCTSGNIKRIEFSCTSSNPASGFGESYADGVWTGDAAIVEITATEKQVQMNTVTVYYKVDARAEAGLAYAETAIEKHVGDEAFVNALTNPNNLTVAYESSNTDVAEVAANGTVTIKAEGTATITASFGGDEDYKPASVSYELTVNEAGLDNVTFDAKSDYTADASTLTLSKGGFTLTFTDGAMHNKSEYRLYQGKTMTLSSTDYIIKKIDFTCTSDKPITGFGDAAGLDKANSRWTGEASKVELTASGAQVRIEKMVVYYVEDTREASGLAWSANEVEITLGDAFTAATLQNPNGIDASAITIESDNEYLAEVNAGVVSLVDNATGTAHITATFAGNDDYKPATISYTIIVNDPTPEIITNPTTYLNFGSVEQGATINAKNLQVTLQNVAAATVAITGEGAAAFSADPMALSASGTIIVSASSANVGTFAATLTISDNAGQATAKEISLSLTVTEPVAEDDVTGTWTLVTDASTLAAGKKVIIAQYVNADGNIQTMAAQSANGNNRTAITSSVAGTTLTPAVGTKVITLADAGEGKFYFQASDGYIYNGSSSTKSYLKTKANNTDASWTIEIEDNKASINSVENTNRTKIFYNSSNDLFNCYASGQSDIALYMLEEDTPEPPVVDYTEVRTDLTEGWYYTMCLDKAVTAVKAGSIWRVLSKAANGNDVILEEVTGTLDAGRPYIFRAAASTLEVAYTGDAVLAPVTEGNNGLVGSFTQELITVSDNNYIIYNNALYFVNSEAYVGANRAYLDMTGVPAYSNEPQQGNAPRRRVTMAVHGPQVATGIDALNTSDAPAKVLINGQLFIIRGEKMFDAKGQLVK